MWLYEFSKRPYRGLGHAVPQHAGGGTQGRDRASQHNEALAVGREDTRWKEILAVIELETHGAKKSAAMREEMTEVHTLCLNIRSVLPIRSAGQEQRGEMGLTKRATAATHPWKQRCRRPSRPPRTPRR